MTTQLTPATLDIIITKVTNKAVHYTLTANGQTEKWFIPKGSAFNTAVLMPGTRYIVTSKVVLVKLWNRKLFKKVTKERYDWTSAIAVHSTVRNQARTAKQRQASAALAAMPLVDNGTLIKW